MIYVAPPFRTSLMFSSFCCAYKFNFHSDIFQRSMTVELPYSRASDESEQSVDAPVQSHGTVAEHHNDDMNGDGQIDIGPASINAPVIENHTMAIGNQYDSDFVSILLKFFVLIFFPHFNL